MRLRLALAAALALGCGASPVVAPADAAGARDVATDAGHDLGGDAGDDVGMDAAIDEGADVPDDLAAEAAVDDASPVDAPVVDGGVTLAVIEARVFRPHCAVPSCHASSEPTGHMRLDEDFPRSTLRDVSAMGVACGGQGFVRVVPGDPAGSLLYRKISEDAPPCGSRMPQGGDPLSPELIALVHDWIAAGAP